MTKQVQFSDEAYARLAALKQPGESFSDVVLRVVPRPSLAALRNLGRTKAETDAHEALIRDLNAADRAPRRRPR